MCSPIRSKEWRCGLCFDSGSPENPTHPDAPTFPIHSFVSEAAGIVPTARIERPPLHRGSSASKKGTSPLLPIPPSSLASLSWNGTRVGPTAAVERAHSDRARSGSKGSARVSFHLFHRGGSASKKDGLAAPYPTLLRARVPRAHPNSLHLSLEEWPRLPFTVRILPSPDFLLKGSLVDPLVRASNEVTDDPSKLARSLFRDGG